jgi:hypothetical protein
MRTLREYVFTEPFPSTGYTPHSIILNEPSFDLLILVSLMLMYCKKKSIIRLAMDSEVILLAFLKYSVLKISKAKSVDRNEIYKLFQIMFRFLITRVFLRKRVKYNFIVI